MTLGAPSSVWRGPEEDTTMTDGAGSPGIFERQLDRQAANDAPLSPLSFLARAAAVHPGKTAVIHGDRRYDYREFAARCRGLGAALAGRGICKGDTVALLAGNIPPTLEAHFGVPLAGAVLNALNVRLDAAAIAFCLEHGEAKALIVDREFGGVAAAALRQMARRPLVIDIADPVAGHPPGPASALADAEYEDFIAGADAGFPIDLPADEWQAISLNYTSGTTGNPKGVVYHHRGAYLNSLSNILTCRLDAASVYLWTLPMFHCNGWSFTWSVTAVAGTHVCLPRVDPAAIYALIKRHGVTHLCGAPIVLNLLANAPDSAKVAFDREVRVFTGGAAPPSAIIAAMERNGFAVGHLYGLTETYGPALVAAPQDDWPQLTHEARTRRLARQGVPMIGFGESMVADPQTLAATPADATTIGEVMLRGNTVMKGYLKNPSATAAAFAGGWFHSGDLGVRHPDLYVEIKDRSKDIIISGGENISSLEVEEVLYRHPKVLEAAVVARPDALWGETPCAFVTLRPETTGTDEALAHELIEWCRGAMARFKAPKRIVFGPLPKTSTGKIQKYVLRERARALPAEGAVP
jgi:fatty-acyl-CoA synthase